MKITKNRLSMFMRTRCEKQLFLSLHSPEEIKAVPLPVPAKRPGIGVLSVEGKRFETARNDQVVRLFGSSHVAFKTKQGAISYSNVRLTNLVSPPVDPYIALQPEFSIRNLQPDMLRRLGFEDDKIETIPDLSDFIPDLLLFRTASSDDHQVTADGAISPLPPELVGKPTIAILDIKHAGEANPSYCAEIALYAIALSNWIVHRGLALSVSAKAYLWTRSHQADSRLDQAERDGVKDPGLLMEALLADCDDANLKYYLPTVRSFFEEVVRVIRKAEEAPDSWRSLDWHVANRCSACDWLGDERHLSKQNKLSVQASPSDYCMPCSQSGEGHLSLIPGITRGAKDVLGREDITTASELANVDGVAPLQGHTSLKRDARNLPLRAKTILDSDDPTTLDGAIAAIASSPELAIYASVNFDSSAGLLTGLAVGADITAFRKGEKPLRIPPSAYLVEHKTLESEKLALEAFLTSIADCIERAEEFVGKVPKGQIHFWERRQFTELCNAIGRHLGYVLGLAERKARALAWLFAPDDLLTSPQSLEASTVAVVDQVVERLVIAGTPYVMTLFGISSAYYDYYPVQETDSFYREYLSNSVPRERIYEIWSGMPQVKRGKTQLVRSNLIHRYSEVLEKQVKAIRSICKRLRKDFKGMFRAPAPRIPVSVPQGTRKVAFDSKLWIWWDRLNFCAEQLSSHMRLAIDGEQLEATYEAVILTNGRRLPSGDFAFTVNPGSTEAKFRLHTSLTLGKLDRPGLPLERISNLIPKTAVGHLSDEGLLSRPLWSVVSAELRRFDRVHRQATVRFSSWPNPNDARVIVENAECDLLNGVFLVQPKSPAPFDWSRHSTKILQAIGNPKIATPGPKSAGAMGIKVPKRRNKPDPETVPARILWDAARYQSSSNVIDVKEAQQTASVLAAGQQLNSSQEAAVAHCLHRALTIIWGPPGTGKTKTLVAFLACLAWRAQERGETIKVLVTGPTYDAVMELVSRAVGSLSHTDPTGTRVYLGYSSSRPIPALDPVLADSPVVVRQFAFSNNDSTYEECLAALQSEAPALVIVGATVRQARRFPVSIFQQNIGPVFDVVVIDETSQVSVSQATSALVGLKELSRLVVAGDHLQMPPITAMTPPAGAEYMVGSFQTYLTERFSLNRCTLDVNYRSGQAIVDFAHRIGYPVALTPNDANVRIKLIKELPGREDLPQALPWSDDFSLALDPSKSVVTVLHDDESSSQGNLFEAQIVASLVWALRQSVSASLDRTDSSHNLPDSETFWGECIGIVTPHRAQRALCVRELTALFPDEALLIDKAVDTVERFQGGERHTIIVTFAVGDVDIISSEEAFLMQLERTNVAISRTMGKCIVVMPRSLANYVPEDQETLKTAVGMKIFIEDICNASLDIDISNDAETREGQLRFREENC